MLHACMLNAIIFPRSGYKVSKSGRENIDIQVYFTNIGPGRNHSAGPWLHVAPLVGLMQARTLGEGLFF